MCWKVYRCAILWSCFVLLYSDRGCDAISNAQFNASLRDFSVHENDANTSEVKTLQKEYQRYAHFAPVSTPVRFKEVPDSALAPSLSHGRGLLHHSHHGYGLADYEETPHVNYGYEYHFPDEHEGHYDGRHQLSHHHHLDHSLDHHDHHDHHPHYEDHKHGYGYHHKHFEHFHSKAVEKTLAFPPALAAKTVLWPIAGIALLGAAAALVSNPVLLQLGVVSGKRRRREAEESLSEIPPTLSKKDFSKFDHYKPFYKLDSLNYESKRNAFKTMHRKTIDTVGKETRAMKNLRSMKQEIPYIKKAIQTLSVYNNKEPDDKQYIPIPLKFKN